MQSGGWAKIPELERRACSQLHTFKFRQLLHHRRMEMKKRTATEDTLANTSLQHLHLPTLTIVPFHQWRLLHKFVFLLLVLQHRSARAIQASKHACQARILLLLTNHCTDSFENSQPRPRNLAKEVRWGRSLGKSWVM